MFETLSNYGLSFDNSTGIPSFLSSPKTEQHRILGLSEPQWVGVAPVVAYWLVSGFYETLEYFDLFKSYQIQPTEEEKRRNVAKRSDVMKHVIGLNISQILLGIVIGHFMPTESFADGDFGSFEYFRQLASSTGLFSADESVIRVAWLLRVGLLAGRQLLALFVMDTWMFWAHYAEHQIPWLYRNVHAKHHQVYTPYASSAFYNHWAEGFGVDTMGALLAATLVRLTTREQMFLFTCTTIKIVEDHCGYVFPWSPFTWFGMMTGSNIIYHNVHHQGWGVKNNFENFFTVWDRLMGSEYLGKRVLHNPPSNGEIIQWPEMKRRNYFEDLERKESEKDKNQ